MHAIAQQTRITALRSGINLTVVPDTIPFITLFDTDPEADDITATVDGVIKDLYAGRVVTSPQQVISRLTTRSIEDPEDQQRQEIGWNDNLDYPQLELLFMAHLRRYILGGDGTARACKFVKLITGDEYLPLPPLGALMVSNLPMTSTLSELLLICLYDLQIRFVPFINEHGVSVCGTFIILILTLICLPSILG